MSILLLLAIPALALAMMAVAGAVALWDRYRAAENR